MTIVSLLEIPLHKEELGLCSLSKRQNGMRLGLDNSKKYTYI